MAPELDTIFRSTACLIHRLEVTGVFPKETRAITSSENLSLLLSASAVEMASVIFSSMPRGCLGVKS